MILGFDNGENEVFFEALGVVERFLARAGVEVGAARVTIVTGSGLGAVAQAGREVLAVPYAEIPGLASGALVAGHDGFWRVVEIGGTLVHLLSGRRHLYEGIEPARSVLAVRLFAALGVKKVLLTNAAGGLRAGLGVGELMLIEDHLSLMFRDAWRGMYGEGTATARSGDVYDAGMKLDLLRAAREDGGPLASGVYAGLLGPNYETRAEVEMLRRMGADAVGMSTVPEAQAARELGLRVAGISLIANTHVASATAATHEEVLQSAALAGPRLAGIVRRAVAMWAAD